MATTSQAGEIQFAEDFALADDRAAALEQLIPGTEDYFYYHCLHHQNLEQFDRVESLLKQWIKRHNYTDRVREIQHRQALLNYPRHPQESLDYLRQQLNLRFDHQRERLDDKPQLPTRLDPGLISRETLTQLALQRQENLGGFTDSALDWLVGSDLNEVRRRDLLTRLTPPRLSGTGPADCPGLELQRKWRIRLAGNPSPSVAGPDGRVRAIAARPQERVGFR